MKIRPTAQAVIYREKNGKTEFLLLKRWDKYLKVTHFRLVKGKIEEGEKSDETVVREIQEETGLTKVKLIKKIGEYSYVAQGIKQEVETFLVKQIGDEDIKIDSDNEEGFVIEDAIWFSPDEAIEKLNYMEEKEYIKKIVKENSAV